MTWENESEILLLSSRSVRVLRLWYESGELYTSFKLKSLELEDDAVVVVNKGKHHQGR
jgi:hypothetical protein